MSHIKNFKDWFRVYESAGFRYRPGMAIFEAVTPGDLDKKGGNQESIETLSNEMKDIKATMLDGFNSFISAWKNMDSNANWGSQSNAESQYYETWFKSAAAASITEKIVTISAQLQNKTKYIPPTFSVKASDYIVTNGKGRLIPFVLGDAPKYCSPDRLFSQFNANQMYRMTNELTADTRRILVNGKTKDEIGKNWDSYYADGLGKWYWPKIDEQYTRAAANSQIFVKWASAIKFGTGSDGLGGANSLGGGIKASDIEVDLNRLEQPSISRKWCFYTVKSVEKSGGDSYNQFETTSVQVPVGGGTQAVAVKDDKQSLPGSSGLFAQGSKTPVPAKAAGQLEALQKILSQYSNITSIKVQGSASWEWTNGNARDDAQNLALAKIRAQWFIDQLNVGTNKVATMWMPTEADKVVNGVKQVVGEGAIVQPTNDVKTAPDWRVTNFFITGDKVTEKELPKEWITVTETGDITLKYDKVTITEHLLEATWESPGLITSKGWGQEKGKKDIKSDLKQSTKWKDLKAGQEIVINDKSDPPKPVGGGVDGKQIFVVGEGTEKNTLKVKLVTTKDGQKSEKEIDNVIEGRYLREVKPKPVAGEDNL